MSDNNYVLSLDFHREYPKVKSGKGIDPGDGKLDGEVIHNVFIGVYYEMEIRAGGYDWLVQNTKSYPVGTKVSLDVIPENIQIMHKPKSKEEEAIEVDV